MKPHPPSRQTDEASLLDDLTSDNPVRRYQACQQVQRGTSDLDRLTPKLLGLLADPTDWDCGHYVAVAALEALIRIDPTASICLAEMSDLLWEHAAKDPSITRRFLEIVRGTMSGSAYLGWMNQVLPTPHDDEAGWLDEVIKWLPADWYDDDELVGAMLELPDASDTDQVWRALYRVESIYAEHLTLLERNHPDDLATSECRRGLAKLRSWTGSAPNSVAKRFVSD